jgi:hypothetical protein
VSILEGETTDAEADENGEDGWGSEVEPDMTTTMCLFVDKECIRSVRDKTVGSTPFVKTVDVAMGTGQKLDYDEGTIKVAITSPVPAFYAALYGYDAIDVASKVSEDGIWMSIGPWDSELEGRMLMLLIGQ